MLHALLTGAVNVLWRNQFDAMADKSQSRVAKVLIDG